VYQLRRRSVDRHSVSYGKEHLVNSGDGQCKKLAKRATKIARTSSEAQSDVDDNKTACGNCNTTGGSNASSDLHDMPFVLPARRQKLFDEQTTQWFISTTPAQRMEHPAFQVASLQLGATPPSRKDVHDVWLP
jgi:hypothetical protein